MLIITSYFERKIKLGNYTLNIATANIQRNTEI